MEKDIEGIAEPLTITITIKDTGECVSHVVCSFCRMITTPFEKGRCPMCVHIDNLYPIKSCKDCGETTSRYSDRCEDCSIELRIRNGSITVHEGPYDCMLYVDDDYYCDEWEAMDTIYDNETTPLPKYAYLTEPTDLKLDAWHIVEHACEDLFEGVIDHISRADLDELQDTLDAWVAKVGLSSTWYPDYKKVIALPWDDYFKSNT